MVKDILVTCSYKVSNANAGYISQLQQSQNLTDRLSVITLQKHEAVLLHPIVKEHGNNHGLITDRRNFFVKLLWENKVLLKTSTFEIVRFASICTASDRY